MASCIVLLGRKAEGLPKGEEERS